MSAPAISPAPSPAPGPAQGSGSGAQGPQEHGAISGFEVILTAVAGDQNTAAGDTRAASATAPGGKPGAKPGAGGKTSTDDGKTKPADDGTAATTDSAAPAATANPAVDPSRFVLAPPLPAVSVETATVTDAAANAAGTNATAVQTAATIAADTSAAQTAATALAQLTAGAASAKADAAASQTAANQAPSDTRTQSQTANAADLTAAAAAASAATDATATAKATLTAQKAEAAATTTTTTATATAQATPQTPAAPVPAAPAAPQAQAQAADAATAASLLTPAQTDPRAVAPDTAKPVAAKGSRVDLSKASATPGETAAAAAAAPTPGSSAKAAGALLTLAEEAPKGGPDEGSQGPVLEAKSDAGGPAQTTADQATSSTTTPATLIQAAAVAVRGAPQTVANLAAQIVKKLDGRSSQFDVQLDPIGLGKVDVRIAIGADGRMSAAMRFDTPQAAAELKARSGELQQAMEQAGFDLSGGMSFDVASGRGQGGQGQDQQANPGASFRGRAFQAALDTSDAAPPPQLTLRRAAPAGVDIRI